MQLEATHPVRSLLPGGGNHGLEGEMGHDPELDDELGAFAGMLRNTPDTAPPDTPILVWVWGAAKDRKSGAWKMGRVVRGEGLPDELRADGMSGAWDIPFWHPLPPPAEKESKP